MLEIDLKGQNILVTGGAGAGVAAGVVEALHSAGAHLILLDNRKEKLQDVQKGLKGITIFTCDIRDASLVEEVFNAIATQYPLHGLVNNAGVGLSKPAHAATDADFANLFAVNVEALWRISKLFVKQCIANSIQGSIVNISSVHAHTTQNKYAIYCGSKNAVIGLTRGMAVEVGPMGIRVNAVGPGYVHAEQNYDLISTWTDNPEQWVLDFFENQQVLNFEIRPVDIGHTVAFLLSDLARCITGQNLYVDNGTTSLIFNRDFT